MISLKNVCGCVRQHVKTACRSCRGQPWWLGSSSSIAMHALHKGTINRGSLKPYRNSSASVVPLVRATSGKGSSTSTSSSTSRKTYRKKDASKPPQPNEAYNPRKPVKPVSVPAAAAAAAAAVDELACVHFGSCSGCSLQQQLHDPPIVTRAKQFFASRWADELLS
jgi:hypothetical protein